MAKPWFLSYGGIISCHVLCVFTLWVSAYSVVEQPFVAMIS